ncbi:ribbon-helix-helix protein, CopG family [Nonomuraea sp. NPDC005983]
MTIRLSAELMEGVRERAEIEGCSMQEIVLAAVDEYLARRGLR